MSSSSSENVKVFVRCRPLLPFELSNSSAVSVSMPASSNEITLVSPDPHKPGQKVFYYDGVFDAQSNQEQVYEQCAFSLVESVIDGFNATIFAYGQTGSGKTYSMVGDLNNEDLKGIIPRSFEHIIKLINACSSDKTFFLTASYMEIYNEEIHDLLKKNSQNKPTKCDIRENMDKGFFVKDLSQVAIHSAPELISLLLQGNQQKAIGETKMNEKSSRSHTLFTLRIESSKDLGPSVKPKICVGKLNLVDLAGSERQNKTQATDIRFKEAVKINLSLSALGNVISALAEGKHSHSHIPYRDSKLTKLLQDSLGGNSKTIMLANINPNSLHYEETLGTLRYASRTKLIKNKPIINEDPKDAMIRTYLDEINKLKEMLQQQNQGVNGNPTIDPEIMKKIIEEGNKEKEKELKEMESLKQKALEELEEKNKIIGELQEKENVYERIRMDKQKLEEILLEKERILIQGQQAQEDSKKLDAMRRRIKLQRKQQEELIKEKENKEQELKNFERKYVSIQEELLALRKTNKDLFEKLQAQRNEIDDLSREYEIEKENLLETIREQEKELSFYEELVDQVFTKEDIIKIRGHTLWSDSLNRYKIPPYIFRDKDVKFPNLSQAQGIDFLEFQKKMKEMDYDYYDLPEIEIQEQAKENKTNEEKKDKEGFLVNQKINQKHNHQGTYVRKAVGVKPMKIFAKNLAQNQEENQETITKKKKYDKKISIEDFSSPSLGERTKMKKEYLRALDTMIETYTDKYGKDKIILPQNMSIINAMSFTDFKDLEKNLDLQMIKAKNNLNSLLEPLPPSKNEAVIRDLIEENPIFRQSTIIEKHSALFNRRVPASPKSVVLKSLQGKSHMNGAKNPPLKKP